MKKRNKLGQFVKGSEQPKGSKHPQWKGDSCSYNTAHWWVNQYFKTTNKCEHCGTEKASKYEWANISKKYKRVRSDWLRLCTSCHHKYDKSHKKAWETRRKNLTTPDFLCLHCEYIWKPIKNKAPERCARCNSRKVKQKRGGKALRWMPRVEDYWLDEDENICYQERK